MGVALLLCAVAGALGRAGEGSGGVHLRDPLVCWVPSQAKGVRVPLAKDKNLVILSFNNRGTCRIEWRCLRKRLSR